MRCRILGALLVHFNLQMRLSRRNWRSLKDAGIPASRIIILSDVFDRGQDFETEDILTRDFYSSAVVATYPAQTVIAPEEGRGKRTKLYELTYKTEHGIGFSKRRVGDTVKRVLGSGGGDEASLAALGQLTNAIWEKLRAKVTIQAHPSDRHPRFRILPVFGGWTSLS